MNVALDTVVTIRFVMMNSMGEVIESTMQGPPVQYLHGCGEILPLLEIQLEGRQAGDMLKVYYDKQDTGYQLSDQFILDVVIENVRSATAEEISNRKIQGRAVEDCGPGCSC